MKYIDAEKLIAEIKRQIEETKSMKPSFDQFWAGQISAFKGAIKIAESLQQEHPSLPSNIDEAAEEYSENILANNEDLQDAIEDAFKEGAKWMAEQGETKQGVVTKDDFIQFADDTYIDLDPLEFTPAFALKDAKEVIVQIRKKQ